MARRLRRLFPGMVYHLLNRATESCRLFEQDGDYRAFLKMVTQAVDYVNVKHQCKVSLYGYCLMPNHWHFVAAADQENGLSLFLKWLCTTHACRARLYRESSGRGHIYQSRFKSFPVESDGHFLTLMRYVEANPKSAGLVTTAQEWAWSSFRAAGSDLALEQWPVPRPKNWVDLVNTALPKESGQALEQSLTRGSPFGTEAWTAATAKASGLAPSLKKAGRPWGKFQIKDVK
jgi:putative transposase